MDLYSRLMLKHIRLFLEDSIAGQKGHSWYPWITEINHLLKGSYVSFYAIDRHEVEDQVIALVHDILTAIDIVKHDEWEEFRKIPYFEKPFVVYLVNGIDVPETYKNDELAYETDRGSWKWKLTFLHGKSELFLNHLLREKCW